MKKFFGFIALLSICIGSFGQDLKDSQKAKEILDQVSAKTKTYSSIFAEFSFSLENKQESITESHNGTIKIKGNKYQINMMDVITYFDGTNLWTHMKDAEEVNVSVPDANDEGALNPAKIFSLYEKGFKFQFVGEKMEAGKSLYEIDLFPENRDKNFSRIKLFIYKDNLQLHTMQQIGKDGNNYTVKVKKMQTNLPFADSEFIFNKASNPNVEIIDMR